MYTFILVYLPLNVKMYHTNDYHLENGRSERGKTKEGQNMKNTYTWRKRQVKAGKEQGKKQKREQDKTQDTICYV